MASTQPLSHLRDARSLSSSASSGASQNRDSNMVRASVLDAALLLGFGGPNSTVANWIFNNPLDEEEEPTDDAPIPELTPSSATSDDSHSNGHAYPYTLLSAGAPPNKLSLHDKGTAVSNQYPSSISSSKLHPQLSQSVSASSSMEQQQSLDITPSPSPVPLPFPSIAAPSIADSSISKQSSGTKLRKKVKSTGGGYESEGHISDGGRTKKEIAKARREIEAKAMKAAEKEAKVAKKEARQEEKVKKSKSKKEKKDRSKSPINGDATDYETDAASDGAYLSEAVSFSSVSSKKTKASSKSRTDKDSDSGKPKKSPSFFRRKTKATPVVPPMPTTSFPLSTFAPPSTPMPVSSGSGSTPASASASAPKVPLPPIAARFATTSATPPPVLAPTPTLSVFTVSPHPTSPHPSPLPSPNPSSRPKPTPAATSAPSPISTTARDPEEGDDAQSTTTSSHSSDRSMPTSLPTSTSTSSLRNKPSRIGLFKFGGSTENMKAKPNISLPLTHTMAGASPMSSRGASPKPGTPPSGTGGFLGRKPILEVRTQDFAREGSPIQSASSYTSAMHLPSPLAQISLGRAPSPASAPAPKKGRPRLLDIQHPHDYNGSQTLDPPRRPNFAPVPPPTPPPTGPLPRVPPPMATNSNPSGTRGPASTRPFLAPPADPAPSRTPSPLQRGKEAPFPSGKKEAQPGRLDGFEGRMEVPRYRGIYGFGNGYGASGNDNDRSNGTDVGRQQQPFSAFSADSDEDEDFMDPEMLTNEFQQIRQRFYDHDRGRASVPVTEPDRYHDSFSGGDDSHSYSHLNSIFFSGDSEPGEERDRNGRDRKHSDERSMYPDDDKSAGRRTMYELEGRDSRHYDDENRISSYSAAQSVYSVMDDEKSGEARERFLSRVAAMYGEGGREVVPPVPKLPEGLIIKGTGVGRRRVGA